MEANAQPSPARRRSRLPLFVGGAVLVLAAAVAAFLLLRDDGDGTDTVKGPPQAQFTMLKPDGWSETSESELAKLPGRPLAVLRRKKGGGLVVVNAQARFKSDLDKLGAELDKRLKKSIPDFRKVGVRKVRVKAGEALLYSYARTRRGTAHTLLVVPVGRRSFTVNAAVPAGAKEAARDVGRMLQSFDTPGPASTG